MGCAASGERLTEGRVVRLVAHGPHQQPPGAQPPAQIGEEHGGRAVTCPAPGAAPGQLNSASRPPNYFSLEAIRRRTILPGGILSTQHHFFAQKMVLGQGLRK